MGVCSVFTIEKDWDISKVTWRHAKKDKKWEKPGGDYDSESYSEGKLDEKEGWENYTITSSVKYFVKHQDENYGFFIYPASDNAFMSVPLRTYVSSEFETDSLRPKLTITLASNENIMFKQYVSTGFYEKISIMRNNTTIRVFIPCVGPYHVSVYSISGKEIVSFDGSDKKWYYLSRTLFSKGMFFVKIKNTEKILSHKFVVAQ